MLMRYLIKARYISIHALLAESDPLASRAKTILADFYPRSPCGERHVIASRVYEGNRISIHALLAESDHRGRGTSMAIMNISIHALLAESDKTSP